MASHAIVLTHVAKTVPAERHTAAYRLFHYPRLCLVQQMFTISPEYLQKFGALTSGDPRRDREDRSAWVYQSLTAVDMCELVSRGGSIMFDNVQLATVTYLDLVTHLRNWLEAVQKDVMLDEAPLDDLHQFDELAAMIFPYASAHLMANEEDSGYGAFLARARRNGRALLSRRAPTDPSPTRRLNYTPLSDQIAEWIFKRRQ